MDQTAKIDRMLKTTSATAGLPEAERKELASDLAASFSIPDRPIYWAIVIGLILVIVVCLALLAYFLYKNPSSSTAVTGLISFVSLGIGALVGALVPQKS